MSSSAFSMDALLPDSTLLGVNLLADSTFIADFNGLHDKSHAAGFASAVLLGAVLAKVAPLVVAASHSVLVVEAHCVEWNPSGLG
jgi:hypothetical protein